MKIWLLLVFASLALAESSNDPLLDTMDPPPQRVRPSGTRRVVRPRSSNTGRPVDLNALNQSRPARVAPSESQQPREAAPVDLDALNTSAGRKRSGSRDAHSAVPPTSNPMAATAPHRGGGGTPVFKALFDLLLHYRKGITPLTFDNYHNLLLIDYFPSNTWRFSFEFNPGNPRYYEVEVKATDSLSLRMGRIAVPFDDMNPHNLYGGFMNTSKMIDGGNAATAQFLPDIWAELGIGLKYKWVDDSAINITSDLVITNGFQTGGNDPVTAGSDYPNFAGFTPTDNNDDKAIGTRTHVWLQNTIGFGASAYTCRYTPNSNEARRLYLVGLDAQLRIQPTRTTIKAGYLYGKVSLPGTSAQDSYLKGGLYADYEQKVYGGWFFGGRAGLLNGDDRVEDVNDVLLLGGRAGYMTDFWSVAAQYHRDFKGMSSKRNVDYMALRFVIML